MLERFIEYVKAIMRKEIEKLFGWHLLKRKCFVEEKKTYFANEYVQTCNIIRRILL